MLELDYESKIIKKTVSDQRNMFLPANVPSIHSTLILGSVFNDYVVFYMDFNLSHLSSMTPMNVTSSEFCQDFRPQKTTFPAL